MNDRSKNMLLIVVAIVGAIGWLLALADFNPYTYPRESDAATPLRILYGLSSLEGSTSECLFMLDNDNTTSSMVAYVENPTSSEAQIELKLTARNAEVSFDKSGEFKSTTIKTILIPPGTADDQSYKSTFYVRHSNPEYISIYLDGKIVSPVAEGVQTMYALNDPPPIILFKDDQSGNYCW